MDLAGKHVVVVGLAQTGLSVANVAAVRGAKVTVNDGADDDTRQERAQALPAACNVVLGGHPETLFDSADLVVASPGVPEIPIFAYARNQGTEVIAEIELAHRLFNPQATLIAVTGTNGKSTTTSLIGLMAELSSRPSFVGGNLGNQPLIDAVGSQADCPGGLIVAEVAGFMLEQCTSFRPDIGLLLNITPDHLDRYGRYEIYRGVKQRMFQWQTPDDYAIANLSDQETVFAANESNARPLFFSSSTKTDAWYNAADSILNIEFGDGFQLPQDELSIVGRHNIENALASALAAKIAELPNDIIAKACREFVPCPHRMEFVCEDGGVSFYDDSKGTNVAAVAASLAGFPKPVVLIAGGVHKGSSYKPMIDEMKQVGRGFVVLGEAAQQIAKEAETSGLPIRHATSMKEAVALARQLAQQGDAVVLSPGCSSYDMYKNFEERGRDFRSAVKQGR